MFVAQKLKVRVKLSPYIHDIDVRIGFLDHDVCISNIETSVDSQNAVCSWGPDKEAIHAAIKALSSTGFKDINKAVELIRLLYLLGYPVDKILCNSDYCSETEQKRRRRHAIEFHLVRNITIMLERIYSIAPSEVPSFKTVESQLESSAEPAEVFLEWKKLVEFLIEEKKQKLQKHQEFMNYITNCCRGSSGSE